MLIWIKSIYTVLFGVCTQSLHLHLVGRQELGQLREEAAAERAVRDCQGGMKPHCLPKILFGVSIKKVTFDHAPKRLVFAGLILISAWLYFFFEVSKLHGV